MVKQSSFLAALLVAGILAATSLLAQTPPDSGSPPEPTESGSPPAEVVQPPWFTHFLCPVPEETGACSGRCDHCGVIGYVDYLNWAARRSGLDFAAVIDPTQLVNPLPFAPLATQSLDFARASGVRASVGYHFAESWDIDCTYTYFRTNGENSVTQGAGPLTGLLATQSFFDKTLMDSVEADGSLQLQIYDFEASWHSLLNDAFGFRAFGGFRWAELDQQFNNSYSYVLGVTPVNGTIHLPSIMDAGGVRFGAELQWLAPDGVRVFARGAQSILVANFGTAQQESDTFHGVVVNLAGGSTQVVPVTEAAAGIGWCHGPWEVSGGYEMSNWFNLAQANRASQNLLLDGCFVRIALTR
jgi:hypothetical protein